MLMTPLPIHLGPGVDAKRIHGVLEELALEPVELAREVAPEGPSLYLVASESLHSRDQLNHLLRSAAVVVLHPAGSDPPEASRMPPVTVVGPV